jgi:macrophage erythroblast attacher
MKSTLEFNLRLQEYIELIRERKISEAIQYSRKHLTPWSDTHMKEIQQAMALVAFTPKTSCYKYRFMFDDSRWQLLIHQFRADNYALHALTNQPLIKMTLQAGLAALKTPMCSQPNNKNINCPVCDDSTFGALAQGLPNGLHRNSCIVCRISGVILNEDNPPYVLPNGYVYGHKSLLEMASQNKGMVSCPRTGAMFPFSACRKVHIMT